MRILNYLTLPVIYSENFYDMLKSMQRYSKFAYVKDVLVGAISCKEDIKADGTKECYIMTITVLAPYRRYGIASKLLEQAMEDCMRSRDVSRMVLHVQSNNEQALSFYKKHEFVVEQHLENYYTELEPSDCYFLSKTMELPAAK